MNWYKKLAILAYCVCGITMYAAEIFVGDNAAQEETTFSFPMRSFCGGAQNAQFFLGGSQQRGQSYSLVVGHSTNNGQHVCFPIASKKAVVNEQEGENPLYNQAIHVLDRLPRRSITNDITGYDPVVVTKNALSSLHLVERYAPVPLEGSGEEKSATMQMQSLHTLYDAHGADGAEIVGIKPIELPEKGILVALKPKGGAWGGQGSGIGLVLSQQKSEKETRTNDEGKQEEIIHTKRFLEQVSVVVEDNIKDSLIRSASLSGIVKNNDKVQIDDHVDLHWDVDLQRLYGALRITGGPEDAGCVHGIFTGRLERSVVRTRQEQAHSRYRLHLYPVLDDIYGAVVGDGITHACGANAQIAIHAVRTLATSTRLHYIVVQGGTGDGQDTRRMVYAAPLVSNVAAFDTASAQLRENAAAIASCKEQGSDCSELEKERDELENTYNKAANTIGMLADKQENPLEADIFSENSPYRLVKRGFSKKPHDTSGLMRASDAAALVGGGSTPGEIHNMVIHGDTVFVAVGDSGVASCSGVYSSQALFDETGKIKAWTTWRHVIATQDPIVAAVSNNDGSYTYCTGDSPDSITTVKKKSWCADQGIAERLWGVFKDEPGGVQGFFDIPSVIPDKLPSFLVAVGARKVMLVGKNSTHATEITSDDANMVGPLTCAEIARVGNRNVLFVGGAHGVAIADSSRGIGWDEMHPTASSSHMHNMVSFTTIGTYSLVKKLIYDDGFLYVLTDKKLLRIDCQSGAVGREARAVASVDTMPGMSTWAIFTDCVISDKCALLATSKGLLVAKNDIRSAGSDVAWQSLSLPQDLGAVTQLIPVSTTGRAQDVARNGGGMVYALNMHRGKNKGHIVRLSVQDTTKKSALESAIVTPLSDSYGKDRAAPFIDLYGFKDGFASDGSLHLTIQNSNNKHRVALKTVPADTKGGSRSLAKKMLQLPINTEGMDSVTAMVYSSVVGSWLLATNSSIYAQV